MTKIAITGAAGRMGKRIAALAIESEVLGFDLDIVAAMESPGHEAIGRDVGELAGVGTFGVKVTEALELLEDSTDKPDVLIDFSLPEGTLGWLDVCRAHSLAMVIGTTGLTASQQAEIAYAAGEVAIVQAANATWTSGTPAAYGNSRRPDRDRAQCSAVAGLARVQMNQCQGRYD